MKTKDTSHDDQATKIGEFTEWKLLAVCCTFVIATWAATWFIMYRLYGHLPSSDLRWISANEFGDMFGCLSCLFSGLAFAGLIVSIKQQRVDIQRQVAEMRCSQEEFQKQTILAQRHIMTTTMFSYMKNMNEKRDALKYADDIEEVCSFLMKYFDSGQENKPSFSRPSNDAINSFREKMERLSTWRRTLSSWFQ